MAFQYDVNNFFTPPQPGHTPVFFKAQYPDGRTNDQEYILIHITKNAGSTLRHSVFKFNPHEDFDGDYTSHYTVDQVIAKYGADKFFNAFSFALLRDPFPRFLSWIRYLRRPDTTLNFGRTNGPLIQYAKDNDPYQVFEKLVADTKSPPESGLNLSINKHLWPQHKFIMHDGEVAVKFLGLCEKFYESVNKIFNTMGFPGIPEGTTVIGHNVSNKRWLKDAENDPILRERVREFYAQDAELHDRITQEF